MATLHAVVTALTTGSTLQELGFTQPGLLRYLALAARSDNSAVVFVGSNNTTLSTTSYGQRIEIPVSNVPAAPIIFESSHGLVSAADIRVMSASTSQRVSIMAISA